MSELVLPSIELVMREAALFAATGFLLLGLSDLAVDLLWIAIAVRRRFRIPNQQRACAATLAPPRHPGRIAIFVPAWDEGAVIGKMLDHARASFGAQVCLYIGCYPNDPATIAAVSVHADPRIRLVVGPVPGPTSKAACLNILWEEMRCDEAREGCRFKAVVLHDAEDIVHSAEIGVFDTLIERFDLVQLPVVPLIDKKARWIGAHYADEFAEAHGKALVVREALGAAIPSAGVGCAIARDALDRLALRHGMPFDPDSLTEDYELGLRLRALGGRAAFVRLPAGPGRAAVATRGFFPATLGAAVTQKARWMTGIALSGWDRLGWQGGFAERWMRMRDRQSILSALLLFAAYVAVVCGGVIAIAIWFTGYAIAPVPATLSFLLSLNLGLLVWRLSMRFGFVTRTYGWQEGVRALPRVIVGNIIAMLAARRAVGRYLVSRQTGQSIWDKTAHDFPTQVPAE